MATGTLGRRVALGLPLLGLSLLALRGMNVGTHIPTFEQFHRAGAFDLNGNRLPLPKPLYRIALVDDAVGVLVALFVQMFAGFDQITYWQTLSFVTDYAGLYAVLMMESERGANRGTPMHFPDIFGILAQVRGIGVLGPIYFCLSYIMTPMSKLEHAQHRQMRVGPLRSILPVTIVAYLGPHFQSYLNPSLERRAFWNSIWQPFPVWISLLTMMVSLASRLQKESATAPTSYMPTCRTIGRFYIALSAIVYLSTLYYSKLSPATLFIPNTLSPSSTDVAAAVRSCLQWDQICSFGAGYVWLGLTFADIDYGRRGLDWWHVARWAPLVALCFVAFGPGAVFVGLWTIREELLAYEVMPRINDKTKDE